MTKKLEELFNLAPLEDDIDEELEEKQPMTEEDLMEETTDILTALSNSEKIDIALTTVTGLNEHDREMDDIADRAFKSFKDLSDLGVNTHDAQSGRIFEVAATMLKTAMEAKNSKVDRKLKTLELLVKKDRLDHDKNVKKGKNADSTGNEFDRNELLGLIRDNMPKDESE